jgi:hypothetical protein
MGCKPHRAGKRITREKVRPLTSQANNVSRRRNMRSDGCWWSFMHRFLKWMPWDEGMTLDESGFLNARCRCELCLKPVNGLMPECFQITSDPFRSLQPTKICKFNLKVWPWSGQNWSFHVLFMCHDFQTSSDVCHAIDKLKRTNRGFISLSMLHLHWSNWLISFRPKSICQEFAEVAFSEAFVLSEETKQKRRLSPVGLTRRKTCTDGGKCNMKTSPLRIQLCNSSKLGWTRLQGGKSPILRNSAVGFSKLD